MRRFLSQRYVMTSNDPFEKNKIASTLAATWFVTKCKEAERWWKLKGNRKRCGEETEIVYPVFPWETTSGKTVLQRTTCIKAIFWPPSEVKI